MIYQIINYGNDLPDSFDYVLKEHFSVYCKQNALPSLKHSNVFEDFHYSGYEFFCVPSDFDSFFENFLSIFNIDYFICDLIFSNKKVFPNNG